MKNRQAIRDTIARVLAEDIGSGDITTLATVPADKLLNGRFLAKADGIIAGLEVVHETFAALDEQVQFTPQVADGTAVSAGDIIATIHGPAQSLLSGERVALNLLQRMSGIATLTHRYVGAVAHTNAIILDTRKTAPGLRPFDKWAVQLGGGQNHRYGLSDMVLIKENHIVAAGGITPAVQRVRVWQATKGGTQPVEVEITNLTEFAEALALPIDRIMLDNMSLLEMREAVRIGNGRISLEASGNVNLTTVAAIAETGVDYISSGALTHSVTALDVSLLLQR